jgi:hypothetical protein
MMTTTAVSTITVKVNRAVEEDVKEETLRNRRITVEKHIKDDPC